MRTVIGIDYGTQSARAVLVDAGTGQVLCSHSIAYPHGVMAGDLASAQDYEAALMELMERVIPSKYRDSVAGICVDATSLTLVPMSVDGQVLCQLPGFANRHHAQIKLWKCHEAQAQAEEALCLAEQMGEPFLGRTGGTISSEWMLPKLLKIRDEDPQVYEKLDAAMDLCEFLTFRLTGKLVRSTGSMSYKGLWAKDLGFPSDEYLNALRPGFAAEYKRLLRGQVFAPGTKAGVLRPELCQRFGLRPDVAVAAGTLDGHTSLVALGALNEGDAALVVGTSNVLTIQTRGLVELEGICGIAMDGLTEGLYGIDSGQSGTGDMLEWYLKNALPEAELSAARERNCSAHQYLAAQAERPWENTVIAADWWNGSRNAPCDLSLRGMLYGLSMQTRPRDVYLALLQAIACGTREIIEQCQKNGIMVNRLLATGGITGKNPLLMQEYANLLNRTVYVGQAGEGPALGAAIFAAVAAGIYETPVEAHAHMGIREFTPYEPDADHREQYEGLYIKNHKFRQLISIWKSELTQA